MASGDKKYSLPLTGGTMTGSIAFDTTDALKHNVDTSSITMCGGTESGKGARAVICGKSCTGAMGWFKLQAHDGSKNPFLVGQPNGVLTWAGSRILTEDTGDTTYLKLSGGTMTGAISLAGGNNNGINNSNDTSSININGGSSISSGASVVLNGKSNGGTFDIAANNGSTSQHLVGNPGNVLNWAGDVVLTADNGTAGQVLVSKGTFNPVWTNIPMTIATLWSGETATPGNYVLSEAYTKFKYLIIEGKSSQGYGWFGQVVVNPGKFNSSSLKIAVCMHTRYLIVYFPSTTMIYLNNIESNTRLTAVYGVV